MPPTPSPRLAAHLLPRGSPHPSNILHRAPPPPSSPHQSTSYLQPRRSLTSPHPATSDVTTLRAPTISQIRLCLRLRPPRFFHSASATNSSSHAHGPPDSKPSIPTASTSPLTLTPPAEATETETKIHRLLVEALAPTELSVQDISGGCGSMFSIEVTAEEFQGLSQLKMQRRVNKVIKEMMEEGGWHGVRINCRAP